MRKINTLHEVTPNDTGSYMRLEGMGIMSGLKSQPVKEHLLKITSVESDKINVKGYGKKRGQYLPSYNWNQAAELYTEAEYKAIGKQFPSPREQAEQEGKLDPSELECITTVYHEVMYIPRERKPERLIPIYKSNGVRVVEKHTQGRSVYYRPVLLHPENILTEFSPPSHFDIIHRENGKQESPVKSVCNLGLHLWTVKLENGTHIAVTRWQDKDGKKARAWQEVQTATA